MTHSLSVLKYPGAPLLTLPCLGFHGDGDHPETCYDSYSLPSWWYQLSGPLPYATRL